MHHFISTIEMGKIVAFDPTDRKAVPNETMVRSMDFRTLAEVPGVDLTRQTIGNGLSEYWWDRKEYWSVDTRVHMLMKGMIPCIPGWHHDDVQRSGKDNQPDYDHELRAMHAIFLINADVAPTEFAVGIAPFESHSGEGSMYGQWSKEVDAHIAVDRLKVVKSPDCQWVYFDDRSWHRGVECPVKFGHRLFIRVGMHYRMVDGERVFEQPPSRANQVRRNAQVYMQYPAQGW